MATITTASEATTAPRHASAIGPLGRLGRRSALHRRRVFLAWILIAVGFGIFAPRVEAALAGAGWEDSGSESVRVRDTVQREFSGQSSAALQVVVSVDDLHHPTTGVRP